MIELNSVEVQEVNGGFIQFLAGAIAGGVIYDAAKVLYKCENNWSSYGTCSYNSLMYKCMTDTSNWGL